MPQTAASLHLGLSTAMIPGGPDKPLQILLPERAELLLDLFFSLTILMQTYFFLVLGIS